MQVLEWMEEARVQPSNGMYFDILSFAQKSGATYSSIIQERVGMQVLVSHTRESCFGTHASI